MNDKIYKILIHFNPKLNNYWDSITPCNISERPKDINKYYLDFSSKAPYPYKMDSCKIPLYYFNRSWTYHPTVICQYALGLYEAITKQTKNQEKLINDFLIQADWLVNNHVLLEESAFWFIGYDMTEYNLTAPWSSGLVQGEAISVLLRANIISQNDKYLQTASKSLKSFLVSIEHNGFTRIIENHYRIFEEYPTNKINFVLNGYIFALYGLYDFILFNKDNLAEKLFTDGTELLIKKLNDFDLSYWSKYSLYYDPIEYPSSYKYHALHIEMLNSLYYITSDSTFLDIINKWEKYRNSYIMRIKSLVKKYSAVKNTNFNKSLD